MLTDPPKLIQPREHKAKVSIWADLTVNDIDIIDEINNVDQLKDVLSTIFNLEDHAENLKSAIVLDLYYYTVQFGKDHNFTKEQLSAFFSIVKRTHEVCIETPFGNVQQCFRYFKDMVLCHAVKRPPHSIDLFSPDEVRKITEYVINTYFRNFKLYKYVFTPLVRLDLSMTYVGIPESPPPSEEIQVQTEGEETTMEEDPLGENAEASEQHLAADEAATPKPEESPAAKELRDMIRGHLSTEIQKLRVSVEEQLKDTEESINQKLMTVEGLSGGGNKGGRHSGKGKKK